MTTRYAHTNLIARDWRRLAAFYDSLFECLMGVPVGNLIRAVVGGLCAGWGYPLPVMIRLLGVVFRSAATALWSRRELILENIALRHQLSVLQASSHRRLQLTSLDRALWTTRTRTCGCHLLGQLFPEW